MDKTKKISYQSLKEKLSDEKLKLIIAGSGGGDDGWGTCCANFGGNLCVCGVPKKYALNLAQCHDPEGKNCEHNWCCDSCGTASWVNADCWD